MHLSMSWDTFLKDINEMKAHSDSTDDDWLLNQGRNHEYGAYLSKKLVNCLSTDTPDKSDLLTTFDYHVVYNPSYGCPVLCFNAWEMNGSLLTIEECWKQFNLANFDYKYHTLTQMEHPVLMKPFITLHPCKTSELMQLFANSKNVVVSWLSTVGPVVGLNISSHYAKLTN